MKEAKKLKSKAEAMVSLGFYVLGYTGSPFCHVAPWRVYGWGMGQRVLGWRQQEGYGRC